MIKELLLSKLLITGLIMGMQKNNIGICCPRSASAIAKRAIFVRSFLRSVPGHVFHFLWPWLVRFCHVPNFNATEGQRVEDDATLLGENIQFMRAPDVGQRCGSVCAETTV